MNVFVIKKIKGRDYLSEKAAAAAARFMGFDGARFSHDESGKPLLFSADNKELYISVSHTKNYWACAVSEDTPMGLDIEEVQRSIKPSVINRLHTLERKYLEESGLTEAETAREFLSVWTRKEAALKLWEGGIRLGLKSFSVISEDMSYSDIAKRPEMPEGRFSEVPLCDGLVFGLCVLGTDAADVTLVSLDYQGELKETALSCGTSLLASKMYTEKQLYEKLTEKGYSKEDARFAADTLKQRGYLSDADYAALYIKRALEKGKSRKLAKKELIMLGIEKETAETAVLCEEGEMSERERAMEIAAPILKKQGRDPEKLRAKAARLLYSRGFDASVIYSVINSDI